MRRSLDRLIYINGISILIVSQHLKRYTWYQATTGPPSLLWSDTVASRFVNGSGASIWKLRCQWLRDLRQHQIAVVIHPQPQPPTTDLPSPPTTQTNHPPHPHHRPPTPTTDPPPHHPPQPPTTDPHLPHPHPHPHHHHHQSHHHQSR